MTKILAVDDEELNLDIIVSYMGEAGYKTLQACSGEEALEILAKEKVDLVVLDRMMPGMNGLEVVLKMKASQEWEHIPIIMQTAAASSEQIMEGMHAGVYHYLAKPYEKSMLLSIVRAALRENANRALLQQEALRLRRVPPLITSAEFIFRTLEDVANLSTFLGYRFSHPETFMRGLSALMVNAVEHGNLGITYNEKTDLLHQNSWEAEVERRLALEGNRNKYATLTYEATAAKVEIRIADQGSGFNWDGYIDFDPIRLTDPNGRGIAMARSTCFHSLQYLGKGNEVACTVPASQLV